MRASGSIFHARNLNTPGCTEQQIERQKSCDNSGKRYVNCHAVMLITGQIYDINFTNYSIESGEAE